MYTMNKQSMKFSLAFAREGSAQVSDSVDEGCNRSCEAFGHGVCWGTWVRVSRGNYFQFLQQVSHSIQIFLGQLHELFERTSRSYFGTDERENFFFLFFKMMF